MTQNILVVDDEEPSRQGLVTLLAKWGYNVEQAGDGPEALGKISHFHPDVVLTDLIMPGVNGLELIQLLQKELIYSPVIVLTGHGTIETAVSAIKQGAYDYLTKPLDMARLRIMVEKALEKGKTHREMVLLRKRLKGLWGLGKLVGKSKPMQEIYNLVELASPTPARVLILGESGTGKELVAQSLHDLSERNNGPFIPVNCSAIPETLLESEIFGHEKGAFTGALERKPGCFELAHGGTLFLDEVAEMSPSIQAKFLRILQDSSVKRIGGTAPIQVDVRVVAATNKDPLKAIQDGLLREDLYYRLNVCTIQLPPLRERKDDIPLLVKAFIEEFNANYSRNVQSIDDEALSCLLNHTWPGNVRELRNAIERAVMTCTSEIMTTAHLPEFGNKAVAAEFGEKNETVQLPLGSTIEDAERQLIVQTLKFSQNNKTRAAEILGVSLKTLHNKLHRYGLHDAIER
ncbi:MAG: sigma-54 dependent transcriptional regulator [Nitrospirales bacterium]|nr:sigma-54 dependent transcriptional regulator [Nitrospirales bacterium]